MLELTIEKIDSGFENFGGGMWRYVIAHDDGRLKMYAALPSKSACQHREIAEENNVSLDSVVGGGCASLIAGQLTVSDFHYGPVPRKVMGQIGVKLNEVLSKKYPVQKVVVKSDDDSGNPKFRRKWIELGYEF